MHFISTPLLASLDNPVIDEDYPNIRIQKITIDNFKSVDHGEIEFSSLSNLETSLGSSNILGLYGQNGSGKTTLIEALYVLKTLLSGKPVPSIAENFISQSAEYARMETVFEAHKKGENNVDLYIYSFCIKRRADGGDCHTSSIMVFDELLTAATRDLKGKLVRKTHKIYDANHKDLYMNGTSKILYIKEEGEDLYVSDISMKDERDTSINKGGSSIFYPYGPASIRVKLTEKVLDEHPRIFGAEVFGHPKGYEARLLRNFAERHLFVAGANLFKIFENGKAPIYFHDGYVAQEMHHMISLIDDEPERFKNDLERLNTVLDAIIPGLRVTVDFGKLEFELPDGELVSGGEWFDRRAWGQALPDSKQQSLNDDLIAANFFTERNGVKVPLNRESEGIKRIIYVLDVLIAAYNNPGTTVAVDEFDAGIFEYLLGEILKLFEESGKGQLIFTSHNLRPLEVINKRFICFTTTNPENRYVRLRNINGTYNLRDIYFRQILLGGQGECLYDANKRYKLRAAFERAGDMS